MRADARLTVTANGADGADGAGRATGCRPSRIARLRSDGPLLLRPAIATGPTPLGRWNLAGPGTARVSRAAGTGGPLGGDDLRLHVDVGPGAALVLRDVSATVALPGPHAEPCHVTTTMSVGRDATLVWLPEPVIAAHRCDHHFVTRIDLAPGARLLVREELLLGRHGETPGTVRQRLRVQLDGRPLHDQELALGPDVPGWHGPAVTGGRTALGSVLVVDPLWAHRPDQKPAVHAADGAALFPLSGPAVLAAALAPDSAALRHQLDACLTRLDALPVHDADAASVSAAST
ncbi:urease accessory protein UreD [Streptomyces sp. NPDC002790]|uniref:urease accessory protein UreD n=1 Tax=Streptomyces sp. NPDC002790 TaxID=3154431 RepID=UPI0033204DB1